MESFVRSFADFLVGCFPFILSVLLSVCVYLLGVLTGIKIAESDD